MRPPTTRRPGPPASLIDPGAQSERTYLAWHRTGLSFAGIGLLLLKTSGGLPEPAAMVPGLVLLAVSGALLAWVHLRYHRTVHAVQAERTPISPGLVGLVAAVTVVTMLVGLVLDFLRR